MKKLVVIVTQRFEMKEMYYGEFSNVFTDKLDIISYSMEYDNGLNMEDNPIGKADVILLTEPNIFKNIKHMVKDDCKIIHLRYAFLKNNINALKNLPKGTNTLVCFNYTEVSTMAAMTIYEMGITNLNLTIYNPKKDISEEDFDIAIVGENSAIVPEGINTIISLGRRKVSLITLIDLAISTDILDDEIQNRIITYSKQLALPGHFMSNLLINPLFAFNNLKTIIDSIDDPLIILDNDFKVSSYNINLVKMFNIGRDIKNKRIDEIEEFNLFSEEILKNQNLENFLIEINNNKNIMISVKPMGDEVNNKSYIVTIRDATEFIQLESTLRRQLEKRGHVTKYSFENIYSESKKMAETIEKARIIAKLGDKPVLIIGESGTGKELFAQSIHNQSYRRSYPFVAINCAALSSTLLESELFGYEEGAFTGGRKGGNTGLFETANNGTLFLDEIGDMPLETQAKILRVLEEKEFMKLGGNKIISINVRIISATNKNLRNLIDDGKFRLDLYYRLNTLMFNIPPLRDRKEDIRGLIGLFLEEYESNHITISHEVMDFLIKHYWNGNVRELKNCIDYMVNISGGNVKIKHLPDYILEEIDYEDGETKDGIFHLLNEYEQEVLMTLLDIISYSGGGRRSVYEKLKEEYDDISVYKTRKFIDLLSEHNFIKIGTGRSGMKITETGRKFLEKNM